mgnify:CR=1 FL=1
MYQGQGLGIVQDALHGIFGLPPQELLPLFLQKIGFEEAEKLRQRVARVVKTTFASSYVAVVSLEEALSLESIAVYGKQATGEKYLVNPSL